MDFLCRNSFTTLEKNLENWKDFYFFFTNEFFRFCFFLLFEVNLEFIWFSTSCFGFNAYFMWNFPAKLKEKLDIFQKFSKKKIPKFLNFVGTKKFLVSVNLKLPVFLIFWILVSMHCNSYGTGENSWHVWEFLRFFGIFCFGTKNV